MTFTFSDLREHVLRERILSPEFFGSAVTYRDSDGNERMLDVYVQHKQRPREDSDGRGELEFVQQIDVIVMKDDLPDGPKRGHRIVLELDDRPYVYAFSGEPDKWTWQATFERSTRTALAGRR